MAKRSGRWLRTDEAEDVAGSIRHCTQSYDLVGVDDQTWKWVALSLHSALQGACVCHLVTTFVPVGAVSKQNAAEWIAYSEASRSDAEAVPPATRLLALPGLLKEVRKPKSAGDRSNPDGVVITDSELRWLLRFHNDVRNEFTHFSPKGWSLEISGLPQISILAVRIIREIQAMGWAFRHREAEWLSSLSLSLDQLEDVAQSAR